MDINFDNSNSGYPDLQLGYPEEQETQQDVQDSQDLYGHEQTPQDGSHRQDFVQPLGIQSPVPVMYTDGSVIEASPQIVYVHDQNTHNVLQGQYSPNDGTIPTGNPTLGRQSQIPAAAPYTQALPNMQSSMSAQTSATDPMLSSYRLAVDPNHERGIVASQQSPIPGSRFSMGVGSPAMDSRTTVSVRDSQKEVVAENFMELMPNHLIYDPNQQYTAQPQFEPIDEKDSKADVKKRNRRICGFSLCLLITLLLCSLALMGVGIGVGYAIGFKKNKNTESVYALNQTQVLFGSGLAAMAADGGSSPIELFYQTDDGKVRFMNIPTPESLNGQLVSQKEVPTSANLPTPLSLVIYPTAWHLYYINVNHVVWETISNDNGLTWHDGPLAGGIDVRNQPSPNVALRACYASRMNGTTDGIILWAATNETNIVEYSWLSGTSNWVQTGNFPANGQAGIGCNTWNGTTWYTMNVDQDNTLHVWWKDTSLVDSQWAATNLSIPGVMTNTSIWYTNDLFVQMANGSLVGYDIDFSGATTSITSQFTLPQGSIPGSRFSVVADYNDLAVYSQTTGHHITEFLKSNNGWTSSVLTLPVS